MRRVITIFNGVVLSRKIREWLKCDNNTCVLHEFQDIQSAINWLKQPFIQDAYEKYGIIVIYAVNNSEKSTAFHEIQNVTNQFSVVEYAVVVAIKKKEVIKHYFDIDVLQYFDRDSLFQDASQNNKQLAWLRKQYETDR